MSNDSTKISDTVEKGFFRASAADFKKIPGSPIAYWVSETLRNAFTDGALLRKIADPKKGLATTDNNRFLRFWFEISKDRFGFGYKNKLDAEKSDRKWFPLNKGGEFRKWYGNKDYVINWLEDGKELKNAVITRYGGGSYTKEIRSEDKYFKDGITWSALTSSVSSFRLTDYGALFDSAGSSMFPTDRPECVLGLLNTPIIRNTLAIINPTLNFGAGTVANIPVILPSSKGVDSDVVKITHISKHDWDSYETSWDFADLPLLNSQTVGRVSDSVTRQLADVGLRDKAANPTYPLPLSIKETYTQLHAYWQEMTLETQRLEEENNRIFIDAYGLQDELIPEVPLKEITLTCNPHYRYGANKNEEELETLLLADTMKEFISYAVGCMFGRYSLDKPGLILANQGETIEDYYKKLQEPRIDTNKHESQKNGLNISVNSCSFVVQNPEKEEQEPQKKLLNSSVDSCSFVVQKSDVLFPADDDNVIPMLDGDWFTDDVTERFGQFLKVTFGDAHYEENLKFIEQALGKDIRKYFLKDFYTDHLKRYKKRPIYWLFSSPKGTFNALIYMHRYRADTVSVVLNDYLREFRTKLSAHKNHLEAVSISSNASAGDKTKALKDIENHRKMIDELDVYEREVLYPLATEQIEIDLDDGVKVNYQKFGEALKKIPGLAAKEG